MKRQYSILLVICMITSAHAVCMWDIESISDQGDDGFTLISPITSYQSPSLPTAGHLYPASSPFHPPARIIRPNKDSLSRTLNALDLAYPYQCIKENVAKSPDCLHPVPKILQDPSPIPQSPGSVPTPNNSLTPPQISHNPADRSLSRQSSSSPIIKPLTPSPRTRLRTKTTKPVPITPLEYVPSKSVLEMVLYCCWCAPTIREKSPKEKV